MSSRFVSLISLAGLKMGGASALATFAQEVGQSLEQTGFAVLTDHDIPVPLMKHLYSEAGKVFAHGDEVLGEYERIKLNHEVGFTPFGVERWMDNPPDQKRFWQVRRPLPLDHPRRSNPHFFENVFPDELVPGFRAVSLALFEAQDQLANIIADALTLYLDLPEGTLRDEIRDGESMLRVLHYPPVNQELPGTRSYDHTDICHWTQLVAGTKGGLQVQDTHGNWHDVDEVPGSIVLNSGDMLEKRTRGRIKSTVHGVKFTEQSLQSDRYSAPFFVHPRGEVVLDSTGLEAGRFLFDRLIDIGVIPKGTPYHA